MSQERVKELLELASEELELIKNSGTEKEKKYDNKQNKIW
jgi:hypothetical protein